ncbi:NAD(P)-dependent oxidoreductase [Acidiphilium sp. PM]|uniref:NAD(P)-dependent oxidoreductase n=1 Tax=Acidiphilium sp. PM TaxID=1043206 RepID=UPI000587DC74|nr:NAD(P)-dependent oxidoreductase [Acidiphilium sp. PM]
MDGKLKSGEADPVTRPKNVQNEIGWIGVGKMGNPMATRLIEAGHRLTIFDPLAENRASLVARGANVAASVADLAADCSIVFSTIPNDAVLNEVIYGSGTTGGILSQAAVGTILIEMSTVSPQISERISGDLARRGVQYLRCPLSGSTALAREGTLTALASGDESSWESVAELIDRLATRKFYLGRGEEARYMKLVLNALVGATSSILGEAMVLGEKGGLTSSKMLDVIVESAVASPLIRYKQDMMERMDFTPAFSVEQMIKDFTLIADAAREKHVPMYLVNLILQQYAAASNVGYADQDFFSLFGWMRASYGVADTP